MLTILAIYIVSGFVSILVTDVTLHDGSVVNVLLGAFFLKFLIFTIMKKIKFKRVLKKIKLEKEIIFWLFNYLIANSFGMFVLFKYFKIDAIGAEFSEIEKISTLLILSILIPILEELLYRGVICNELLKKNSSLIAVLVSGLIFSITHGVARGLIFLLLGSAFYKSYIYIKSKSIYNSMIIHIINNTIISLVIFYSNSINWLKIDTLVKYSKIFSLLGGLSIIMCVYNNYRMYKNLKLIDKKGKRD